MQIGGLLGGEEAGPPVKIGGPLGGEEASCIDQRPSRKTGGP